MSDATIVSAAQPVGQASASHVSAIRWRTEDWIAVFLGFLVILATLAVFQWKVADLRTVVPTFRWTTDSQIASMTPGWTANLDTIAAEATAKRQQNVVDLS